MHTFNSLETIKFRSVKFPFLVRCQKHVLMALMQFISLHSQRGVTLEGWWWGGAWLVRQGLCCWCSNHRHPAGTHRRVASRIYQMPRQPSQSSWHKVRRLQQPRPRRNLAEDTATLLRCELRRSLRGCQPCAQKISKREKRRNWDLDGRLDSWWVWRWNKLHLVH